MKTIILRYDERVFKNLEKDKKERNSSSWEKYFIQLFERTYFNEKSVLKKEVVKC